MKREWHHYKEWECYRHGMWSRVPRDQERELILKAVAFTGDAELYGLWMMRAIEVFKVSCAHHLSDASLNKRAYIGHAACALAHGFPEYIVRKAWGLLAQGQRDAANVKASEALLKWKRSTGYGSQIEFDF
jgi:hypothetical protein